MITIEDIRVAAAAIEGRVHRTPMLSSRSASDRTRAQVYVKAECFQRTGSFKVRGVFNKLGSLSAEERQRGVIGISAGNHAQALAYGASAAGIRSTVVMPASASPVKAAASRAYGAEVILHGDMFEAWQHMEDLRAQHGYTFVHPFDDPLVMAGQGTVGLEVIADISHADIVIVPVGGGGLISGVATAVKALKQDVRVYGVEPEGAAAVKLAQEQGAPVRLSSINTIADGLSAPIAGENTLPQVNAYVNDVVLVNDEAIREALRYVLERLKIMIEPAAAAGFAALFSGAIPDAENRNVVVVASGGNMDLSRLKDFA